MKMESMLLLISSAATPLYRSPSDSVRSSETVRQLLGREDGNFLFCYELQHLYGLLAVIAFHPPICFFKVEVMIDGATNQAFDIV